MNRNRQAANSMHRASQGFTLVELLVVITIIGILISLLLPAIQTARESARRMQCQNNIKQAGLAVLNYENQYKVFPPSSCWESNTSNPNSGASKAAMRANWVILVLPFMEQQPLHDTFDLNSYISGACGPVPGLTARSTGAVDNLRARATNITGLLCPSDSNNRKAFTGVGCSSTAAFGPGPWARGNYAANAGLAEMSYDNVISYKGAEFRNGALPTSIGWRSKFVRGVMGANGAMTVAEISDGLSNTILLGEVRAGVTVFDSRGVWALGMAGSSALWGHGAVYGDDPGPNCQFIDVSSKRAADDIVGGDDIVKAMGGLVGSALEGMPCFQTDFISTQATMRSLHPGGVNSCFTDGSVHWISDYIQFKPSTVAYDDGTQKAVSASLSVWDCLNCSADGQVMRGDAF